MLVDTHMHLYYWNDNAIVPLLEKELKAGVNTIVTLGVTPRTYQRTLEQPRAIPMVYAGVGIHPLWGKDKPKAEVIEEVSKMAKAHGPKVRFIGEIGLDVKETQDNLYSQREAYKQMIRLANEVDLPINLHCNSAHTENLELLHQDGPHLTEEESSIASMEPYC